MVMVGALRRRIVRQMLWLAIALAWPVTLGAQTGHDVAVVVHPDVPVDSLTTADLRRTNGTSC